MRLLLILMATLISFPICAKVLEAKKKTKVLATPSKGAAVLQELKKGDSITSTGRKGMYWQVKIGESNGFVSVLSVKRKASKSNEIADVIRSQARKTRASGESTSIRSRSAVMGVRGLDESETLATAGNIKPDLRAVYRMEDQAVIGPKTFNAMEHSIHSEIEFVLKREQKN